MPLSPNPSPKEEGRGSKNHQTAMPLHAVPSPLGEG